MNVITIQCPACKVRLKLRHEPVPGRSLRCPRCESRIVYRASVDQNNPETSAPADAELRRSHRSSMASPPKPESRRSELPDQTSSRIPAESDSSEIHSRRKTADSEPESPDVESFPDLTPEAGILHQVRSRRSRRKTSRGRLLASTIIILISTLAIVVAFRMRPKATSISMGGSEQHHRMNAASGNSSKTGAEMQSSSDQGISGEKSSPENRHSEISPTSGTPIPVKEIPFSADLICHLRPAEIWKDTPQLQEFRRCLPELEPWMKSLILKYASIEPESVPEITFAMNFGPRGSEPDVAAVVRLDASMNAEQQKQRFGSRLISGPDQKSVSSEVTSVREIDPRTFIIGSSEILFDPISGDISETTHAMALSASMEQQISESDRDRLLTLVFNPRMIEVHRDFLFPEPSPLKMALDRILQELAPDVELATLSVHLSPHCHLDTRLLPSNGTSLSKLEASIRSGLRKYPGQMMTSLRTARPQTRGEQILAGRTPAMMKAMELGSEVSRSGNHVRVVSLLPQNAAASLAAGLRSVMRVLSPENNTPVTAANPVDSANIDIRQQIQKPILVDFRNQPLQEVIAYISQETGVSISIDGDALKSAGFTQNMPQTLSSGKQSAGKTLHEILSKYAKERDPVVVCVDAATGSLLVTTRSAAAMRKLAELNFSAP